jgi:hypothetical protein
MKLRALSSGSSPTGYFSGEPAGEAFRLLSVEGAVRGQGRRPCPCPRRGATQLALFPAASVVPHWGAPTAEKRKPCGVGFSPSGPIFLAVGSGFSLSIFSVSCGVNGPDCQIQCTDEVFVSPKMLAFLTVCGEAAYGCAVLQIVRPDPRLACDWPTETRSRSSSSPCRVFDGSKCPYLGEEDSPRAWARSHEAFGTRSIPERELECEDGARAHSRLGTGSCAGL